MQGYTGGYRGIQGILGYSSVYKGIEGYTGVILRYNLKHIFIHTFFAFITIIKLTIKTNFGEHKNPSAHYRERLLIILI